MTESVDKGSKELIVIVGAGIVGSALAAYLSERTTSPIVVVDQSITDYNGSTGHAPGYVGQFNDHKVLTKLAIETVQAYRDIPGGFDVCGALEVAVSENGMANLRNRKIQAEEMGLPATLLSTSSEAKELAPYFLPKAEMVGAVHFPTDGSANAIKISSTFRERAMAKGVKFLEKTVTKLTVSDGKVTGIQTDSGLIECTKVVLATGVWSSQLATSSGISLPPIVPVAHPYVHGPQHERRTKQAPFVRIPEYHIYLRDHGTFDGLGSYDHVPLPLDTVGSTAIGEWPTSFSTCLNDAYDKIENGSLFNGGKPFNGIFSVTPDNLPIVGPVEEISGCFVIAAVWVTHAAGCARVLADMMSGQEVDQDLISALRLNRFDGKAQEELKESALMHYNNIYRNGNE